jgi:hypothetical protein
MGLLRSINTQSEFCRQVAKAAPDMLVSGYSCREKLGLLRMSLQEDGICGGLKEES